VIILISGVPYGLVEVAERLDVIALSVVRQSAVKVGRCAGVELDGIVVVRQRLGQVVLDLELPNE
jgi:hypothetical protein